MIFSQRRFFCFCPRSERSERGGIFQLPRACARVWEKCMLKANLEPGKIFVVFFFSAFRRLNNANCNYYTKSIIFTWRTLLDFAASLFTDLHWVRGTNIGVRNRKYQNSSSWSVYSISNDTLKLYLIFWLASFFFIFWETDQFSSRSRSCWRWSS